MCDVHIPVVCLYCAGISSKSQCTRTVKPSLVNPPCCEDTPTCRARDQVNTLQ
jgi:hypothetical protein